MPMTHPPAARRCAFHTFTARTLLLVAACFACAPASTLLAQYATQARPADDSAEVRRRAFELYEQNNYVEAVPALEKLIAARPDDVATLSRLGFALYGSLPALPDAAARKRALARAREVLTRSRALGDDSNLTQMTLDALRTDVDVIAIPFTDIKEAEAAIRQGEEAFVKGDLDKALFHYQRALKLDPKLYSAALYAGDMYFKRGYAAQAADFKADQMRRAGEWFARAIEIDPNRETAHRYWGDALISLDKREEARAHFVDAIIAEPYNRAAYVGLTQWAQKYQVNMAHPEIKQPASSMRVTEQNGQTNILLDPKALGGKDQPNHWASYDLIRATWGKVSFAKEYPNEKTYRHSLKEEATALTVVAEGAARDLKDGKVKSLDPSLANLVKLHAAGMLEPFILFARADAGVAQDYDTYRQANRDKLRRYWTEIVIGNKN